MVDVFRGIPPVSSSEDKKTTKCPYCIDGIADRVHLGGGVVGEYKCKECDGTGFIDKVILKDRGLLFG